MHALTASALKWPVQELGKENLVSPLNIMLTYLLLKLFSAMDIHLLDAGDL